MRVLFFVVTLLFACAVQTPSAYAQDYETLFKDFDARSLTSSDKRFLQAALAFEGHYNGLLDGDWGARSRKAFADYSWSEFGTPSEEWHMAMLAFKYFERFSEDGWIVRYIEPMNMSFLFPSEAATSDPSTDNFVNWRHTRSSLSYSVGVHDFDRAQSLHDFTADWHEMGEAPYSVRKQNFAVTSAQKRDGSVLYTRSNFTQGGWSTIMLSAQKRDAHLLNAVSSSISVGYAAPIIFTEGGRLDQTVRNALAIIGEQEEPNLASNRSPQPKTDEDNVTGSGTGFFVSSEGYVLTNAHVVDGCGRLTVDGNPAKIIDSSQAFDLALLRTNFDVEKAVAIFSTGPAKLNSDVTVAGYPYAGLLSGLNVTRGSVSALKGLGGEATQMQITAPVQPGNSGGPVIAAGGEVVGVVVSKLNAKKMSELVGDIPQNVNFAVRGEIAKLYLSQNGVDPLMASAENKFGPEELAERASHYTAFIECAE